MTYLGTDLSPEDYYRTKSSSYENPHAEGIRYVLDRHKFHLYGMVLDMGCGNGLITKLLSQHNVIGVDGEVSMVCRYQRETKHEGFVRNFWDELPEADCAVFCYSLHLAPASRRNMIGYRLRQAEIKHIVVISPFKARNEDWCNFRLVEETADCVGPDMKTIYGRAYASL